MQYQTEKLYLAAIANFYVEQSMPLRTDNMYQLHRILKGIIKRTSSFQQQTRCPITIEILSQISDLLRPAFSPELDTVMLWPAFTLAFFGFLRVSEFTYSSSKSFLAVKDVAFVPNIHNPDYIPVRIKQSKTDPFHEGITLTIAKSNSKVCAVITFHDYILQCNSTMMDEPLFMLQNGQPLSRCILNANLHEL